MTDQAAEQKLAFVKEARQLLALFNDPVWAISGAKELVRNEVRVRIAPPPRVRPGNECILRHVYQSRARAFRERDDEMTPERCRARSADQSGEDRDRGILPRHQVRERDTALHRLAGNSTRDRHPSRLRLHDKVVARPPAFPTKSADSAPDQIAMTM